MAVAGCWWRYFRSTDTGQVEESIALTVTVQLLWNGFVFETFMRSWAEEVERVRSAIQSV